MAGVPEAGNKNKKDMPTICKPMVELKQEEIDRFWSKVALTANPDKCWEWQGRTEKKGYGVMDFSRNGKVDKYKAHRLSYFLNKKEDPGQSIVMHICNNPKCTNINHLKLGDDLENSKHKFQCGRDNYKRGEDNVTSKLKEKNVIEIRTLSKNGLSYNKIAKLYNMHPTTVSDIVRGIIWKHVPINSN